MKIQRKVIYMNTDNKLPILIGTSILKLNNEKLDLNSSTEFLTKVNVLTNKDPLLKYLNDWLSMTLSNINETVFFKTYNSISNLTAQEIMEIFNKSALFSRQFAQFNTLPLTAHNLIDLLIKLANVKKESTFLDPTAGFTGPWLEILKNNPDQNIILQDINNLVASLAYLNVLIFNGHNSKVYVGDSLQSPKYVQDNTLLKFDSIITIPPYNIRVNHLENTFNRFRFGEITSTNSDWGFVSNAVSSLNNNGKAVIILPNGDLTRMGYSKKVRENIIKSDLLESVISLPANFLNFTRIPMNILVFNAHKKAPGHILFIDANHKEWITKTSNGFNDLTNLGKKEILKLIENPQNLENISSVQNNDACLNDLSVSTYIFKNKINIDGLQYHIAETQLKKLETIPLEEIAEVQGGLNFSSRSIDTDSPIQLLRVSDIQNNKINFPSLTHISEKKFKEKYQIQKNDILISIKGTLGKTFIVDHLPQNPVLISSNLAIIRLKNSKFKSEWLNIYLQSILAKYYIQQITTGTAITTLPISQLKKLPVLHLPDSAQIDLITDYQQSQANIEKLKEKIKLEQDKQLKLINSQLKINNIFSAIN